MRRSDLVVGTVVGALEKPSRPESVSNCSSASLTNLQKIRSIICRPSNSDWK